MAGKVQAVVDDLIDLADKAGVRLGALGGVSSVLVAPDGPRLFDGSDPPADVLPEIQLGLDKLEAMKASPDSVDWSTSAPPPSSVPGCRAPRPASTPSAMTSC